MTKLILNRRSNYVMVFRILNLFWHYFGIIKLRVAVQVAEGKQRMIRLDLFPFFVGILAFGSGFQDAHLLNHIRYARFL